MKTLVAMGRYPAYTASVMLVLLFGVAVVRGADDDGHPTKTQEDKGPTVKIVLADGQGKIGAEVPSQLPVTAKDRWRHFVGPKGGADDKVILKAVVGNLPEGLDQIATFKEYFQWNGGDEVPENVLQHTVSRAQADMTKVTVSAKDAPDSVRDRIKVWIVWTASAGLNTTPLNGYKAVTTTVGTSISGAYEYSVQVQPRELRIPKDANGTLLDIPVFLQFGSTAPNAPKVPATDTGVYVPLDNNGNPLGSLDGGADNRWDMSRQMRQKVSNPNGLAVPAGGDAWSRTTYPNYPSDPTCGNDDANTNFEDEATVYANGWMSEDDVASHYCTHAEGHVGNTLEIRMQFRSFARLCINGEWYLISDINESLWQIDMKFKKETINEEQRQEDVDHDGILSPSIDRWMDNGSTLSKDNINW